MNILAPLTDKTKQPIILTFLTLSVLLILLVACNMNVVIPTPTAVAGEDLIPSQNGSLPAELPLVSPTELATVIAPNNDVRIDLNNTIYPPLSLVKENFEKGEYNAGLETIKQWVGVWKEMGVFEGIEIENNSLSPVPLDGRARVVCVDSRKKVGYLGVMFCPPLDVINGGLKAVPEGEKWDESAKPLSITLQGTEELITKGAGIELVYQFRDKYSKKETRYFDSKTGQIIEGISLITDVEIVENEIVVEGATGVSAEYLLGGNLRINEEAGKKYYEDFINSLAGNEQNKDYFLALLGGNPDGNKLLDYLRKNDYFLPPGIFLPYYSGLPGYIKIGRMPIEESIRLDTVKVVVFGAREWKSDLGLIREYLYSLKSYDGLGVISPSTEFQYFGWVIDLKDNRLVIVAGSKQLANNKYPHQEKMTVGGYDGNFIFERDSLVASGMLIQIIKLLKVYDPNMGTFSHASVLSSLCGNQETSGVCEEDITQFFGQGKTMFEPAK